MPDMKVIFTKLAVYMKKHKSNQIIAGCTIKYHVPDAIAKGQEIMTAEAKGVHTIEDEGDQWAGLSDKLNVEADDLVDGL